MKGMTIDVLEKGAGLIDRLAGITKRSSEEVLSDAFRTFLWVLHEQSVGRRVVSVNGRERELQPLAEDFKEVQRYFAEIGWPKD